MNRTITIAAAFASALAAVSCGGGGSAPTSPSPSAGGSNVTIAITGQSGTKALNPNPATVDASTQKVQFKNNDAVTHHMIMDDGSAQTADIAPGATSTAIAIGNNKSYHCTIHPGLVGGFNGSVGDPPPNCSYQYCAGYGGG